MLAALPARNVTMRPLTAAERTLLQSFLAGVGPGACPLAHSHRGQRCSLSGCHNWRGRCTAAIMQRVWRRTA